MREINSSFGDYRERKEESARKSEKWKEEKKKTEKRRLNNPWASRNSKKTSASEIQKSTLIKKIWVWELGNLLFLYSIRTYNDVFPMIDW